MSLVRVSLRAGLLSLIAALGLACGGGGGSSSSSAAHGTLHVNASGATPTWVAVQDGAGAWVATSLPGGSGTYGITDPGGRYGFAMGFTDPSGARAIHIWQSTLADRPQITYAVLPAAVTVTAPVTGGVAPSELAIGFFSHRTPSTGFSSNSLSFTCLPGSGDLVAFLVNSSTYEPTRAWVQRGVNISANATLPGLDLTSATPLVTVPLAITNTIPGNTLELAGDWMTSGGTFGEGFYRSGASNVTTAPILNSAQLAAGDIQDLWAFEMGTNTYRWAGKYFKTTSNLTLNLPPSLSAGMNLNTTTGTLSATWAAVPGADLILGNLTQSAINLSAHAHVSAAWSAGATSYVAPNFNAIAPGWTFVLGQPIDWSIAAQGATYGVGVPSGAQPFKDGDSDWSTEIYSSFTPTIHGPIQQPGARLASDPASLRARRLESLRQR